MSEGWGIGVMLTLLVQTGGLFFWGGRLQQSTSDNTRRIGKLEEEGSPALQTLTVRVDGNAEDIKELRKKIHEHASSLQGHELRIMQVETKCKAVHGGEL